MWHTLKAELDYHKLSLMVAALLTTGLFVFITGWVWSSLDVDGRGMIKLLIAVNLLLWFLRFIRTTKEKSDRHHLLLPISLHQIGLARILVGLTIWLFLLAIFFGVLGLLRSGSFQGWIIWYALSATGIWLVATALPFIFRDLTYIFTGKFQKLILVGVYLLLIAALALIFSAAALLRYSLLSLHTALSLNTFWGEFNSTASGAFILLALSLGISYGSVLVFKYRKSYLD